MEAIVRSWVDASGDLYKRVRRRSRYFIKRPVQMGFWARRVEPWGGRERVVRRLMTCRRRERMEESVMGSVCDVCGREGSALMVGVSVKMLVRRPMRASSLLA